VTATARGRWQDSGLIGVLDAKYRVPTPGPVFVSRHDLVRAARDRPGRFVGLTAPAGYGKSTFLAEWAAAEDRPVAWVSLDPRDDDPANLLGSVALACHGAGLGDEELVADVRGPGFSALGRAAPRLAAVLRTSPAPFVLMLDDLHHLRSPLARDVLGVLVAAVPPGSQLATASRSAQPHLALLRVTGEVLDLGPSDLALDARGAQRVFADRHITLTRDEATVVTARTEGWPAGLSLAAIIAGQDSGQVPTITGDDPYVADYLYREALAGQPEDLRQFLLRTAVLERLSGPLCDAVLGTSGSAALLRRVEESNLFLVPLDRRRQWYRYHDLFREFLEDELTRTEPGAADTLHQHAADWYEAHGSPALAVEHLLRTTAEDRLLRLVSELTPAMYQSGQLSTVQRWYAAIGDARLSTYPPLAVLACWESILTGNAARAMQLAAAVDACPVDSPSVPGAASFESARAYLRAGMCAAGPQAMTADAQLAFGPEPPWSPWRDTTLWVLGEAHLLSGRTEAARAAFVEVTAAAPAVGNFDNIPICEAHLAWLDMDHGGWGTAARHLEVALATIDEWRMHDYVFSSSTFCAAARLAVHHRDEGRARHLLTQAMRSRPTATYLLPFYAARLRLWAAKVHLSLDAAPTARQLLVEIDEILVHRPHLGVLVDEVADLRRHLSAGDGTQSAGRPALTPAELRLLPYLQTHLTAEGIAERLSVSAHTVKAHIKSIYRKLGASSRSEAVRSAAEAGLLGG
jgi:LuxR family maltose regulon positive regulatory protein